MKKLKTCFFSVVLLALALSVWIIFPGDTGSVRAAGSLSASRIVLLKGQSRTLRVIKTEGPVKWVSGSKKVAVVGKKGKVTAKGAGKTVITASTGGKTFKCRVTVEAPSLNRKSLTLRPGQSAALKVRRTGGRVSWRSSRSSVAEVSKKGVVKARSGGSAVVTARVRGKKFSCKVQVDTDNKVSGITLNTSGLMMREGERYQLSASMKPAQAGGKTIVWTSLNPEILSVDQNGLVTSLKSGNAGIRAAADGAEAVCQVYVAETPDFEVYLDSYEFGEPVNYVDFTFVNYGQKELILYNYFIMNTGDDFDLLYLLYEEGDDLYFIDEDLYSVGPGEEADLYLGLEEDEPFLYQENSTGILYFWYDGFDYVAAVDCDGRLIGLTAKVHME